MGNENVPMLEQVSVAAKFASVEPSRFGEEIDKRWEAAKELMDPVKDQVENGILNPVDGLALSSCITGRIFGYEEFHGAQPNASALLTNALLTEAQRTGNTVRQPAATH